MPFGWDARKSFKDIGGWIGDKTGLEQDDFSWLGNAPGGGVHVGTSPQGGGIGLGRAPSDEPGRRGYMDPTDSGNRSTLLALLGTIGLQGLAEHQQDKRATDALKEQEQSQIMANIANILSPGANVQAKRVQPKDAGLLERAAGVGSDLSQGYLQYQQMADANELRDLQRQQLEQQLEDRADQRVKLGLEMQGERQNQALKALQGQQLLGAGAADAGGQVPVTVESPYNTRTPARRDTMMNIEDTGAPAGVMQGFTERVADRHKEAAERAGEARKRSLEEAKFLLDAEKFQQDVREYESEINNEGVRSPEDVAKMENDLLGKFTGLTKDYRSVRDAYGRVLASVKNPSPAGDLSMIFNYMKMLDPGSVVRESEFATAAASGSYGERLKAAGERLLSGRRLSDEMRQDFAARSERLFQSQRQSFSQMADQFQGIAERRGLNPENILIGGSLPEAEGAIAGGLTLDDVERELRRRNRSSGGIMSQLGSLQDSTGMPR